MAQQHEKVSPHSYETFAQNKLIRRVDADLVRLAPPSHRVLDSGTGTGAMIDHLFALGKLQHPFHVVGIDIDADALVEASQKFRPSPNSVTFVQASAESLPFPGNSFDLVLMGNTIHLTHIEKVFAEKYRVLKNGCTFLANTAYESTRSIPLATRRIWGTWLSLSQRFLRDIGYTDLIPNPVNFERYSSADFHAAAIRAGFRRVQITFQEVHMNKDSVEAIGDYGEFARGALPMVPLRLATKALRETVPQLFERLKITTISRNWMFLTAQK